MQGVGCGLYGVGDGLQGEENMVDGWVGVESENWGCELRVAGRGVGGLGSRWGLGIRV